MTAGRLDNKIRDSSLILQASALDWNLVESDWLGDDSQLMNDDAIIS